MKPLAFSDWKALVWRDLARTWKWEAGHGVEFDLLKRMYEMQLAPQAAACFLGIRNLIPIDGAAVPLGRHRRPS